MSDVCIDIIGVVPVQMVFAYALSRMLAIRSLPVYWALEVSLVVLLACLRPGMNAEVRLVMSLPLVLVPLFLSEGSLSRRIVIVALAHLVLFSAELPGGALWVALTGAPVASYDEVRAHFDAFAITHAAHLALLIPLLMALKRVFDRFAVGVDERRSGAWLPVLFTCTQFVLVNIMILLPLGFIGQSLRYYAAGVLLSLACLVADLCLFLSFDRYAQKRSDDARALLLESRLDGCLAQCEKFVESIERTAKLRHDVGNHVQVVLALSERGRFQDAREHPRLVSDAFESAGSEGDRS